MMTFEQAIDWGSRLLAAVIAGGVIGLERERHRKAAGLRTIVLICMGSCLFMISSELVGAIQLKQGLATYVSDPGRIAAQVVSGVGFLGAGAVITARNKVHGLTTAAVVWITAGIGLVIGLDYEWFGLGIAVFVTLILISLYEIEKRFLETKGRRDEGFDYTKSEKAEGEE